MSNAASAIIPLAEPRRELLARLVDGLDAAALNWLSGYAAGLAEQAGTVASVPVTGLAVSRRLTVLYGSQTGNARRMAERLFHDVQATGLAVRLVRADAYPLRELADERLLALVISTHGDGDPPDDARGFVEFLAGTRAPKLPELRYTVLGLGDSSYPKFCSIGRAIDARLAELGAARFVERADADVDFETAAKPWLARALAEAREALKTPLATVTPLRPHVVPATAWSRERPFAAAVLANQRISGRGSAKDIRHIELALEGSGLSYEPGDALGLWPRNPPELVDAVLAILRLDGERVVEHEGARLPLREWMTARRELTRLSRPFVTQHAARAHSTELQHVLAPERSADLAVLLRTQQVIDLLRAYPADWTAEELVAALRPLTPRLYSIASSR
ncbi:MAG: flavodoxin domain-containing protein, partial [Proteobacteria bacterium]|nr:flavodoxin domain-containing protein [Pseudomonadota bacterium]